MKDIIDTSGDVKLNYVTRYFMVIVSVHGIKVYLCFCRYDDVTSWLQTFKTGHTKYSSCYSCNCTKTLIYISLLENQNECQTWANKTADTLYFYKHSAIVTLTEKNHATSN